MASVVRETLAEAFGTEVKKPRWTIDDFTFIGMGRDSNNPRETRVSEHHDDALADAYADWDRAGRK